MKKLIVLIIALLPFTAQAEKKTPYCPIIVYLSTGEYVASKGKFKCFANSKAAEKKGYIEQGSSAPIPSNVIIKLTGRESKNSNTFTTTGQVKVTISKPSKCFFDLDFDHASTGNIAANVISIGSESTQTTASTFVYEAGTFYLDVVSYCDNWTATVSLP